MGIELRFFTEDKEVDIRKALERASHSIAAIGTPFLFRMSGDTYYADMTKKPLQLEIDLDESLYSECMLTARSYNTYRQKAKWEYGMDLDRLVNENLDKKWVEVGAGLGGFTPKVAQMLAESKGPKITIVDPVDYELFRETILTLQELVPDFKLGRADIPEILRRINILTNPNQVEIIPNRLNEIPENIQRELAGKFFAVVDYHGAITYDLQHAHLGYDMLLAPNGRKILL